MFALELKGLESLKIFWIKKRKTCCLPNTSKWGKSCSKNICQYTSKKTLWQVVLRGYCLCQILLLPCNHSFTSFSLQFCPKHICHVYQDTLCLIFFLSFFSEGGWFSLETHMNSWLHSNHFILFQKAIS